MIGKTKIPEAVFYQITSGIYNIILLLSQSSNAACAAESRAIGTRYGEQLT